MGCVSVSSGMRGPVLSCVALFLYAMCLGLTASAYAADAVLSPEQQTAVLKTEERELVESLIKAYPNNEETLILLGNVLQRHGNTAGAIECWSKALQLSPKRADLYCRLGKVTLGKGEYPRAMAYFQKAMRINPAVPGGFTGLARTQMASGLQDFAVATLEQGLVLLPDHASGHELLARLYLQRQVYDKAQDHYSEAIRIEPNYTPAYYGLMSVYSRLNQPARVQENRAIFKRLKAQEMKDLKDRNEAYDDLQLTRASAAETFAQAEQFTTKQKDNLRAFELLARGLAIDPNSIMCLEGMGALYFGSGRVPDALKAYRKITRIDPGRMIGYLNIGMLCANLGQSGDAEAAFQRAMFLAPNSSDPCRELARLYLRSRKDVVRAFELAKQAAGLEEKAENYFVLAWACDLNGDKSGALASIKKAVQLEPDNVRYKQVHEQFKKRQ